MKINIKINVLLFCIFLFGKTTVSAQQYNFTNFSVTDGLPQSQVPAILEDRKGYLWLGTSGGGLGQFDGKKFSTYTTQDGLASNYITALFEAKDGIIWIGTSNGISLFKNGQFVSFSQGNKENIVVNKFLADANGKIWVASNSGLYTIENETFSNYFQTDNSLKNSPFYCLYQDTKSQIWAGGQNGLFKIQNGRSTPLLKENGLPLRDIQSVTASTENVLWIAAYNQGIYLADNDQLIRQLTLTNGLSSTKINALQTDQTGNIWLSTADRGVMIWQPKNRKFTSLTTQQGLPNNSVQSILEDSWGNIWLGTDGGGLSKYSGQQFEHFTQSEGLSGNYIHAITEDWQNRLWIATAGNGIQLYENGNFIKFAENSALLNTTCKSIFEDRFGHMWFGTVDKGLTVFLDSLFLTFTKENGLASNFISIIRQDSLGNIWAASENQGMTKIAWNDSIPSQTTFTTFTTQNGLPSNRINDLHVDQQNRVWVATAGGGIAVIDGEKIVKILNKTTGLSENVIRSFSEDQLGFLWYGTASFGIGNIQLYQPNSPTKNNYNNLTSNNIKLLLSDENNHLWIGSETGLDWLQLDAARNVIHKEHFGKTDGFKGIETSRNTVLEDHTNNLWFGTVNGLTKFNKSIQKGKEYPPKIHLRNAQLLEEDFAQTVYKNWLTDWTNLQLSYDQNELGFEVEALHLSYPDNLQYQWKLKGKKDQWSALSSNDNTYQRTFLPGKYNLQVRAKTEKGKEYSNVLSFPFEIAPPYWQTWWFRTTATILGLLLIGGFIKWRISLVKRRAKRIQDRLEQDKKLLELEQKALQLQMNPHFIFNALNSIQGSINPTDIKTARLQLAKFSKLMRATLENARTDSIPLEEEINTLSNYLALEQFSQGNTFDYEIMVADNIDPEVVHLPSMILQPFVENAIIHGVAHLSDKRGQIKVDFSRKGKRLSCIIEDNGIGRAKAKALKSQIAQGHKSAALAITRERLNLLRNNKRVKNSLQIIDLKNSEGKASGTRVEIIIPIEE